MEHYVKNNIIELLKSSFPLTNQHPFIYPFYMKDTVLIQVLSYGHIQNNCARN